MTYFGRAESITEIRRIEGAPSTSEMVILSPRRSGNAVPVLSLRPEATIDQLEATTDAASVKDTNIPPGACWMYAERPQRPPIRPTKRSMPELPPTSLIQFAIGSTVLPRYRDTARITERFRARVLGCFTKLLTGNAKARWADAPPEMRQMALLLSGRQPDGAVAKGHLHASLFLCGEASYPSRLCVWRCEPFTPLEQRAILDAAASPLPLDHNSESWTITLVPLDKLVTPPPGLDGKLSCAWRTLTPYVPSRHVYDRRGRMKSACSVETQVAEELATRVNATAATIKVEDAGWVKVHRKMSKDAGQTNSDKRGYLVTLTFDEPVAGPITLGSSSHFGLGLFVPV
jgi:CRISPR-associated protein Csb2